MLATSLTEETKHLLTQFLRRDFHKDVEQLNQTISKGKNSSAGLADRPPTIFSGNPFELKVADCIAFIGINPRFQEDRWSKVEYPEIDRCVSAIQLQKTRALEEFLSIRGEYFKPDSQFYYRPYFERIGKLLSSMWFKAAPSARAVFKNYIFKSDCLPWLSTDATLLDFGKLTELENPAVVLHQRLLRNFILQLRPRWIQINGVGARDYVSKTFDVALHERIICDGKITYYHGYSNISNSSHSLRCPLFAHPFVNRFISNANLSLIFKDATSLYDLRGHF
jgi:hypothetical protein